MPFNEWIDKQLLKTLTGAVILGIVGASLRAQKEKEGFKAWAARLLFGAMLAGAVGFMLSETTLDRLPYGLIMFAMGYGGSQLADLIFTGGKKAFTGSTGVELEEEENTTTHEPNSTNQPGA